MIDLKSAILIANNYIEKLNTTSEIKLKLNENPIETGQFCYVFAYGSPSYEIAGNAPIIIDRRNGDCVESGTSYPAKHYLDNYELRGNVYRGEGTEIELVGWNEDLETISAIREIRTFTNLGLKEAKMIAEACLSGDRPSFHALDVNSAEQLVRKLKTVGFIARQI